MREVQTRIWQYAFSTEKFRAMRQQSGKMLAQIHAEDDAERGELIF